MEKQERPEKCRAHDFHGTIHVNPHEYEELFARLRYAERRLAELGEPPYEAPPEHTH